MSLESLRILCVSQMPASPPRFGAQARIHGLLTQLAQRHDVTAIMLVDEEFDAEECCRAMQAYCRDVMLIANPRGRGGTPKRLLQLRSLASPHSFQRLRVMLPTLQPALDHVLLTNVFDVVDLQFPYLAHYRLRQAPPGKKRPVVIAGSHNIECDLARQYARRGSSLVRRLYAEADWRKLRREELASYSDADAVYLCSAVDERRLLSELPNLRTTVIPNAADVEYYKPRPGDPEPDGRTVVFFGLLSYMPNVDGVQHFVKSIWPRIAAMHPDARCKIIGGQPPPSLLALAGPNVEFTGFVADLRPHLAAAAAVVVPLRLGGGTRLKIVEAMAMGKAIVSSTLGAEGIEAVQGRDLLIEDDPARFAAAVSRLLVDPSLAACIGGSARKLAVGRYAWSGSAQALEKFYRGVLEVSQQRPAIAVEAPPNFFRYGNETQLRRSRLRPEP